MKTELTCHFPSLPPSRFEGQPRYRSTARPIHGETMIRSQHFINLRFPAKFCSRETIGNAVRKGLIE